MKTVEFKPVRKPIAADFQKRSERLLSGWRRGSSTDRHRIVIPHRTLSASLILILLLFPSSWLIGNGKMDFWKTPRKGANYFNAIPDEAWFQAAQDLGIEWVRLAYEKWTGAERDFLMGNADHFDGLVQEDLARLIQTLDWASRHGVKVVITPLGLPGARWTQKNDGKPDLRLWNDKTYWVQAARFWRALAEQLRNHEAICAYNILNEPTPEMGTGMAEHGPTARFQEWYPAHRGTSHDLPSFYTGIIAAIREVDSGTPIMLDAGWYAQPDAFTYWPTLDDSRLLFSFHMYEPYDFTSAHNFRNHRNLTYPGKIPFAGEEPAWNRNQIEAYLQPFFQWAKNKSIPGSRLVCGEFGCYRRNLGCDQYLSDVISVLNQNAAHWAFYSFREDEWDGYDYETGAGSLGGGVLEG